MFLPVLFLPSDFFTSELCLLTFWISPFVEDIKENVLSPPPTLLSEFLTGPEIERPGFVS